MIVNYLNFTLSMRQAAGVTGRLLVRCVCVAVWCLRQALSFVGFSSAVAGAVSITFVLAWSTPDPGITAPNLDQCIAYLRGHEVVITKWLLAMWAFLRVCVTLRAGRIDDFWNARRQLKMTARHEAGHALVALTLGIPLLTARVHTVANARLLGGYVTTLRGKTLEDLDGLYGRLVHSIAVDLAGVFAENPSASLSVDDPGLGMMTDWTKAKEMNWVAAHIRPEVCLLDEAMAAMRKDLDTPNWHLAIKEAAKVLLAAKGEAVKAGQLTPIVAAHRLTLPALLGLMEHRPQV